MGFRIRFSREQKIFLKKFPLYFFIPYIGIRFFDWSFFTQLIARVESSLLNVIGFKNELLGSSIFTGNALYEIIIDCSGIIMVIMFLALYYSTEIPKRGSAASGGKLDAKKRLNPVWIYVPILLAFNLVRLLATMVLGISFGESAFNAAHFIFWWVDSGVVVLCWAHAKGVIA